MADRAAVPSAIMSNRKNVHASDFVAAFDARVVESPHAVAVQTSDRSWTFEELRAESLAITNHLYLSGIREHDLIALSIGKSAHHIASLLAAWRCGAAFMPIDGQAPRDRVRAQLEESNARFVVRWGGEVRIDTLRSIDRSDSNAALAYVIYTSGSTGKPKGVRVSHRAIMSVLSQQIRAFGLAPGKRALFFLSTAFDASISDIGTSLLSGATLVIPSSQPTSNDLVATLRTHAITHADLPPSILSHIDPHTLPASLETVVIGGEVCAPHVVRAWASKVRVVNVYGPTEATICTSLCVCDAHSWDRPLVGTPLDHVDYRIENDELLIGGDALALGYVANAELENARFVMRDGNRFYKTGDRVRKDGDAIEFVGRFDRQIKLRGQLIAPEEIESRILAIDGVAEAHVSIETEATRSRDVLTARVSACDGVAIDAPEVRALLSKSLPSWMLPRVIVTSRLGRGSTGKIDRSAFVEPSTTSDTRTVAIARAFEDVLGIEHVAVDDDFFALGGDSLAAVEVATVAQMFGVAIEAASVLREKTPASIAKTVIACGSHVRDLAAIARDERYRVEAVTAQNVSGEDWLVTGATGFLGTRLVRAICERTDGTIHCIVRAADDEDARTRVSHLGRRVLAHAGDVSAPRMGLSKDAWRALTERVGHVVHAAAAVNLVLSFDALASQNVRGAVEVARFVQAGNGKRLTHISSLAVLVSTDACGGVIDERTFLTDDTRIFGAYAQTKWLAETILRRAIPETRVIRPGLLTGETISGASAPTCTLAGFLRAIAITGCIPEGDHQRMRVDITPIDYAADVIADLAIASNHQPIVHVASARGASLDDLVRLLRKRTSIDIVSSSTFLARARERLPRASALALASASHRLMGHDTHRDADLFLLTDRSFDCALASKITSRVCPVASDTLLSSYVDFALRDVR
jgi:amino acid adenylation domain-containing protein/thioester reductase-like protein